MLKGMDCLVCDGWQELVFVCGSDIRVNFQSTVEERYFNIAERDFV